MPATPYQRVLDYTRIEEAARARLDEIFAGLDRLGCFVKSEPRSSDSPSLPAGQMPRRCPRIWPAATAGVSLGLRTVRQGGVAPPTDMDKPRQKRGRRRPDPLISATEQLKRWSEEEPSRSSRDLLEKLQAEMPEDYADGLLHTVQRRLKNWRSEQACALVFTGSSVTFADAGGSLLQTTEVV